MTPPEQDPVQELRQLRAQMREVAQGLQSEITPEFLDSLTDEQRAVVLEDLYDLRTALLDLRAKITEHVAQEDRK